MRTVAIAFTTTGASPKDGHRLAELFALELSDGKATSCTLRQTYAKNGDSSGHSLSAQFSELDAFIGDAKVVVHHAALWRKFMRIELRNVKKPSARRLVREVSDVMLWAQERFPKQRKDLASLGKKAGVTVPAAVTGIERYAVLLVGVVEAMTNTVRPLVDQHVVSPLPSLASEEKYEAPQIRRSLGARLELCWRVLSGQA